jgi:hypothetical protein
LRIKVSSQVGTHDSEAKATRPIQTELKHEAIAINHVVDIRTDTNSRLNPNTFMNQNTIFFVTGRLADEI